jgi:hypothetical protein
VKRNKHTGEIPSRVVGSTHTANGRKKKPLANGRKRDAAPIHGCEGIIKKAIVTALTRDSSSHKAWTIRKGTKRNKARKRTQKKVKERKITKMEGNEPKPSHKNKSKVQYRALLRTRDGSIAEFTPYGVEKITGDAVRMNLDKAKALFPSAACKLESPKGPIHMLIGMDYMKDAPRERDRAESVVLYHSEFNTGDVACGNMSQEPCDRACKRPVVKVLRCRNGLFNPPEFIPAEAFFERNCPGDAPPARTVKSASSAWIA